MKVIFLDIDGVVLPYGKDPGYEKAKGCLACLRQIVDATGAKLVISSSWRLTSPVGLMRLLATVGLETQVIGETPWNLPPPPGVLDCYAVAAARPPEIRQWLTDHPDVTTWVALDDCRLAGIRQVKTETRIGLTPDHVAQAITALKE